MLKLLSAKWGAVAGGIMTGLLLISFFLFPEPSPETFAAAEAFGYVAIFASLAVIYIALNEQQLRLELPTTLWNKISLGVGVSLVAGVIFGIYNVIYTSYLDPDFMDQYYAHYISQLPDQSGPAFEAAVARLEAEKAMFMDPITQFLVMGSTVVLAGIPFSILLAFIHRMRSKPK